MSSSSSEADIEIIESDSEAPRALRGRSNSAREGLDLKNLQVDRFTEPEIRKLVSDLKFLSDFDPEKSTRERRKLSRKVYGSANQRNLPIYDEKGRYRADKSDFCDCLVRACSGCHFPCPSCKSPKCAAACRVYRKWTYETIEHDGKDLVLKNHKIDPKTGLPF